MCHPNCIEHLHVDATIMQSFRIIMFTFPTIDVWGMLARQGSDSVEIIIICV